MHLPALDGLRGFAAYLVFLSHYSLISGIAGGSFGHGGGQIGVMLFFVLSGFLMGYLYGDRQPTLSEIGKFARRRAARVLPLFYFMVTLTFVVGLIAPSLKTGYPVNDSNLIYHYLLIRGVGPFWTIPVEFQYYGIFCIFWIVGYISRILLIFIFIVLIVSMSVWPDLISPISSMRIFTNALCFFVLGTLISYLPLSLSDRNSNILFIISLAALPFLFPRLVSNVFGTELQPLNAQLIYSMWNAPQYLAFSGAMLITAIFSPFASAIFGSSPARYLGKISYSLYLWQAPCLFILAKIIDFRGATLVGFVVANAVVLAVSDISYRLIENPSRRALA